MQPSGSIEEEDVLLDRRWGKRKWRGPLKLLDPGRRPNIELMVLLMVVGQ